MTLFITMRAIAALGLVAISLGILNKNRRQQNIMFMCGGLGLLAYSIYLRDPIFIPLQIVFTSASVWELSKIRK